ncbi:DUF4365 domain-containing protein [Flavobacterium denitrificans]|uniref:DUF4365 domain-containing protein n=1 Tax=Flavobacterium denitrificans TaxID=281361 RepID=UPI000423874B|nr:DUF4365 domain-containing protein [Flavobacterium denitrificans]
MEDFFSEMQLPFANANEELETISNNAFKPLFDIKKFEIRSEIEKDKGIDFHIELKLQKSDGRSVHTNFRFAVQLKATDNIVKNVDGSFSKQIDLSNVNYLLNTGMPAYYVFYHMPSKTFYYENVNNFLINIESRERTDNKQQSYSLRFEKLLDNEAIDKIYEEVLKKGKFQRLINEKMTLRPSAPHVEDKISFDVNLNITDDADIRNAIESVGLILINKAKWKSIIAYHKKASGNVASSALYNLILGMAHYYDGNMFDALKYFKDADRVKGELSIDMNNHLQYFYAAVRYFFGIILEDEFNKIMDRLEAEMNIGLYVKLENAKNEYLKNSGKDALIIFKHAVNEIIESSQSDEHIVINARREILFYEGVHNNMEFVRQCSVVFALEDVTLNKSIRIGLVNENVQVHTNWLKKMTDLHNEAITKEDYFSFYNSILVEVKIRYHFLSNFKILFDTQERSISEFTAEMKEQIEILLEKINNAVLYFTEVGHVENQAASISLQYEILHFSDDFIQAEKSLNELERIIDIYESKELKNKLELLKNRGTQHENFRDFISESTERGKRNTEMIKEYMEEMKKMDEDEVQELDMGHKEVFRIHLFPIGYFKFPKIKVEDVLKVLNVEEDGKESLRQLFGMITPVVNIYNETVQGEGFANGKADDKGITSWQNIYRIRKYFYESKFYRTRV